MRVGDGRKMDDDRLLVYEKSLGKGSYGTVCRYRKASGETIAVKYMIIPSEGMTSLLEASIMATYIHPNINSSIETVCGRPYLYILQEEATSNLTSLVKENDIEKSSYIARAMMWIKQIVDGIDALHRENIIHCDIKPDNILIFGTDHVKVADFSHSVIYTGSPFNHDIGTITYRAPEVLAEESWCQKVDVWSMGCVFYFILSKSQLIPDQIRDNERERVLRCIRHWKQQQGELDDSCLEGDNKCKFNRISISSRWNKVDKGTKLIIESMMAYHDYNRPSVAQIINMFGHTRLGYMVKSSEFRRGDVPPNVIRLMSSVTSDEAILKLACDIYKRIHGIITTDMLELVKSECCVWIASKVITGEPPSGKFTSLLLHIIKAESVICGALCYQLHSVLNY